MTKVVVFLTAATFFVVAVSPARAAPTPIDGGVYVGSGFNFPTPPADPNFPTPPGGYTGFVTYGGPADLLGTDPNDGMFWGETDTFLAGGTWAGGLPTTGGPRATIEEFAGEGTILQFDWSTQDGLDYNNNEAGAVWGVIVANLDFGRAIRSLDSTVFAYWTQDGVPREFSAFILGILGLEYGPHPTDPAVSQVIYFRDGDDPIGKSDLFADGLFGFDFFDPDGTANSETVRGFMSLLPDEFLNDIHIGVMVIPEPSTVALLALGSVLLLLRRRRLIR